MNSFLKFLFFFSVILVVQVQGQGRKYPLKLQPELDRINIDDYLKNEKLVDLQVQCVIYDKECDIVGRWLKPRIGAALSGECPKCTEKQAMNFKRIITYIQEKRPDDYRYGIIKYLKESGINVPSESSTAAAASS